MWHENYALISALTLSLHSYVFFYFGVFLEISTIFMAISCNIHLSIITNMHINSITPLLIHIFIIYLFPVFWHLASCDFSSTRPQSVSHCFTQATTYKLIRLQASVAHHSYYITSSHSYYINLTLSLNFHPSGCLVLCDLVLL